MNLQIPPFPPPKKKKTRNIKSDILANRIENFASGFRASVQNSLLKPAYIWLLEHPYVQTKDTLIGFSAC